MLIRKISPTFTTEGLQFSDGWKLWKSTDINFYTEKYHKDFLFYLHLFLTVNI